MRDDDDTSRPTVEDGSAPGDEGSEAVPESTTDSGTEPQYTHVPEWVSEFRRLYVEPKSRTEVREKGWRQRLGRSSSHGRSAPAEAPPPAPTASTGGTGDDPSARARDGASNGAVVGSPSPPPDPTGPTGADPTPGGEEVSWGSRSLADLAAEAEQPSGSWTSAPGPVAGSAASKPPWGRAEQTDAWDSGGFDRSAAHDGEDAQAPQGLDDGVTAPEEPVAPWSLSELANGPDLGEGQVAPDETELPSHTAELGHGDTSLAARLAPWARSVERSDPPPESEQRFEEAQDISADAGAEDAAGAPDSVADRGDGPAVPDLPADAPGASAGDVRAPVEHEAEDVAAEGMPLEADTTVDGPVSAEADASWADEGVEVEPVLPLLDDESRPAAGEVEADVALDSAVMDTQPTSWVDDVVDPEPEAHEPAAGEAAGEPEPGDLVMDDAPVVSGEPDASWADEGVEVEPVLPLLDDESRPAAGEVEADVALDSSVVDDQPAAWTEEVATPEAAGEPAVGQEATEPESETVVADGGSTVSEQQGSPSADETATPAPLQSSNDDGRSDSEDPEPAPGNRPLETWVDEPWVLSAGPEPTGDDRPAAGDAPPESADRAVPAARADDAPLESAGAVGAVDGADDAPLESAGAVGAVDGADDVLPESSDAVGPADDDARPGPIDALPPVHERWTAPLPSQWTPPDPGRHSYLDEIQPPIDQLAWGDASDGSVTRPPRRRRPPVVTDESADDADAPQSRAESRAAAREVEAVHRGKRRRLLVVLVVILVVVAVAALWWMTRSKGPVAAQGSRGPQVVLVASSATGPGAAAVDRT